MLVPEVLVPEGEVEVPVVPVPVVPLTPGFVVVLEPLLPPMSGLVAEVPALGLVLGTVDGEFGETSGVVPG